MVAGWKTVRIGDCLEFKNGLNKGKEFFGTGTPIVNYMDVYKHPALRAKDIQGTVDVNEGELGRFEVKRNDVFFTRTSETPEEVGYASVLLDDVPSCVFSGFVLRGRPKNDLLWPPYCAYCFATPDVRNAIERTCTYTTRALTNGSVLSDIEIPLPPIKEQKAIAGALGDVDELIASLENLIEKKRALRQGVMHDLLSGQRRLPGFSGERRPFQVSAIGTLRRGSGISRAEAHSGSKPCIRYGDLYTSYGPYTKTTVGGISSDVAERSTRICHGDIVFAATGETKEDIGRCTAYLIDEEGFASGDTLVLTPAIESNPIYLSCALNAAPAQEQKAHLANGDAVVHLSLAALASVSINLPSKKEQDAIAEVIRDIDASIAALEQKIAKLRLVRQGMMKELLSGSIRLV